MDTLIRTTVLLLLISFNASVMAEGKSKGGDEFRSTAQRYDAKSEKYRDKGMNDLAELYARQAEIKRNAAELGDENRWSEIDWTEYEDNERQIQEKISHSKKSRKSKKHKKKGGDEFRHTAELYARQAEIKRNAAELGDEGRWNEIDWTEYEENEQQIQEKIGHIKKTKKDHKK